MAKVTTLTQQGNSENKRLQPSCRSTWAEFLKEFNPSRQEEFYLNERKAYMGDYPTLRRLDEQFEKRSSVAWLIPQLFNLSEYCGCKDKMTAAMIEECASVIAAMFGKLKISEVMLFFFLFKGGKYGKFYGAVDPITITCALNEFMVKRATDRDFYEREQERERLLSDMENTMTYAEYKALMEKEKSANKKIVKK